MKTLLKRSALLLALSISVLVNFSLRASADSTAGIILSTKCQGGYNINIWQNYSSGELLYRATNLCGLAVGYTDPDFPPNHLHISRDPVEKNISFLDDLELAHRSDWNTLIGA